MFDVLFSFRGRMGRLQYFLTGLVLSALVIAALVAFICTIVSASTSGGRSNGGTLLLLGLLILLMIPAALWSAFALQAKRIRDIGWDPVLVIPALLVFNLFDALFTLAAPNLAIIPGAYQSGLGLLVQFSFSGCLLFWPGKSYDGGAPSPWQADQETDAPVWSPPVTQPTATAWPTPPAHTGFGRRGL